MSLCALQPIPTMVPVIDIPTVPSTLLLPLMQDPNMKMKDVVPPLADPYDDDKSLSCDKKDKEEEDEDKDKGDVNMEDKKMEDESNKDDEKGKDNDEDDDEDDVKDKVEDETNDNDDGYENEICITCDQIFTIPVQPWTPHVVLRKRSRENVRHCELCEQKRAKRQRLLYQYDPSSREEVNKLTQRNLNRAGRPSSEEDEGDW